MLGETINNCLNICTVSHNFGISFKELIDRNTLTLTFISITFTET
jgi:hypothetical protein